MLDLSLICTIATAGVRRSTKLGTSTTGYTADVVLKFSASLMSNDVTVTFSARRRVTSQRFQDAGAVPHQTQF